jgi:hypothetical protein
MEGQSRHEPVRTDQYFVKLTTFSIRRDSKKAIVSGMVVKGIGRRERTTQERAALRTFRQIIPLTNIPLTLPLG